MTFKTFAAAIALSLAATGAFATDQIQLDDTMKAQITEMLTADGYEVRSIGMEDGLIEVYAIKDGAMAEIYLDGTLTIVRGGDEDGEETN